MRLHKINFWDRVGLPRSREQGYDTLIHFSAEARPARVSPREVIHEPSLIVQCRVALSCRTRLRLQLLRWLRRVEPEPSGVKLVQWRFVERHWRIDEQQRWLQPHRWEWNEHGWFRFWNGWLRQRHGRLRHRRQQCGRYGSGDRW